MNDKHPHTASDAFTEPPRLRFLRVLVTILTATLIIGFVIIVGLLVTMVMGRKEPVSPVTPANIAIPENENTLAFTRGTGWVAVVTGNNSGEEFIRIYSADGVLTQIVPIEKTAVVE